MKYIPTILLIMGLAVLAAYGINLLKSSGSFSSEGCPYAPSCETKLVPGPSEIGSPAPPAVPAYGSRYYYVSIDGNDKNLGTKISPFRTISKAAREAGAGDVVLIQAGIYYEDIVPLHSGEPGKYITYQSAGNGEVIVDAEGGKRAGCIEIDDKSYLKFIGLTVRGANSFMTWPRAGISMTDGTNHINLDDITAYDNYFGIMAYGNEKPVSDITVTNSRTFSSNKTGNTHYGIFFYKKVYDSSILNNHVAYTFPEAQSYGIEIATDFPGQQANGARRIVIAGNEVDHNESEGIHTWNAAGILIRGNTLRNNGATGIQIEDGSEDIVVEDNLSEDNAQTYEFEAGVWIDGSKNVLVRNNILRRNKVGLLVTSSDRVIVHNNYLYLNDRGAQNLDNAAGLIVEDSVTNIATTHNTLYKNGANGTQHGAVNFGLFHPSCENITFMNNIVSDTVSVLDLLQDSCVNFASDFNNYYNTRPLAISWNQNQTDWSTYRKISGQDIHSLNADPNFVDPMDLDFSLKLKSPLVDSGSVLAWTTEAGSGDTLTVTDVRYFSDGFGMGRGDSIMIDGIQVVIVSINYQDRSIKINRVLQWDKGDPVSFPFSGAAPDMGASEVP
jgi:parallel beta-helix repeat protein